MHYSGGPGSVLTSTQASSGKRRTVSANASVPCESAKCFSEMDRGSAVSPQKFARFLEKVIRMDNQHKNDHIKRARGLRRKTSFLHSNNSSFVPSCEWIYLLKVNLKTSQESLNNEINHCFSFKELMISFRHLTGQSIGWRELGSSPPCSACLELLAWVAPGACWKERSAWGAKTPRRPPGPHPPSL